MDSANSSFPELNLGGIIEIVSTGRRTPTPMALDRRSIRIIHQTHRSGRSAWSARLTASISFALESHPCPRSSNRGYSAHDCSKCLPHFERRRITNRGKHRICTHRRVYCLGKIQNNCSPQKLMRIKKAGSNQSAGL